MTDDSTTAPTGAAGDETRPTTADSDAADREVTFSLAGVKAGFLLTLPIALGVAGVGIAFGVLAGQAGLSVAEAALMSATVVAGASQIIAVELWADPVPILAIVATTFVVNLRYSLMGAALQPWFKHLSAPQAYGSLYFMADENWALTMADLKAGNGRGAFLLGSGLAVWSAWVSSTVVGAVAGSAITTPERFGIDFVLAAVFVALAVELWDGTSSVVPWSVALVVAVATAQVVPGEWYILAGGVAAGAVEVARYDA